MRITSVILKNRCIITKELDFRPTMESVREAIFSSLKGSFVNAKFLDLYAGSGSIGLEAWSRGARNVYFVEKQKVLVELLVKNINSFQQKELGETFVNCTDALDWLNKTDDKFDIVFVDPPYSLIEDFQIILNTIYNSSILTSNSILIYEIRKKSKINLDNKWNLLRERNYGKTKVLFLKKDMK